MGGCKGRHVDQFESSPAFTKKRFASPIEGLRSTMSSPSPSSRARNRRTASAAPKATVRTEDSADHPAPQVSLGPSSYKEQAATHFDVERLLPLGILLLSGFTRYYRLDRPFSVVRLFTIGTVVRCDRTLNWSHRCSISHYAYFICHRLNCHCQLSLY
jgi:hypothetical protein